MHAQREKIVLGVFERLSRAERQLVEAMEQNARLNQTIVDNNKVQEEHQAQITAQQATISELQEAFQAKVAEHDEIQKDQHATIMLQQVTISTLLEYHDDLTKRLSECLPVGSRPAIAKGWSSTEKMQYKAKQKRQKTARKRVDPFTKKPSVLKVNETRSKTVKALPMIKRKATVN